MVLVLEIAAGVVLGVIALGYLGIWAENKARDEQLEIAERVEKRRWLVGLFEQYEHMRDYWQTLLKEWPDGYAAEDGWDSPEEMARNLRFANDALAHLRDGTYEHWIAENVAANRIWRPLEPDLTGEQRFRSAEQ
jgi:hypothetical protein